MPGETGSPSFGLFHLVAGLAQDLDIPGSAAAPPAEWDDMVKTQIILFPARCTTAVVPLPNRQLYILRDRQPLPLVVHRNIPTARKVKTTQGNEFKQLSL